MTSEPGRSESIRVLNDAANDQSKDRSYRSETVFFIFRCHVRPGFTSSACRKIMEHAKWLDEVRIEPVRSQGGGIPVDWPPGSSLFSMAVLPDENGRSDWQIYFTLTGLEPNHPMSWQECRKAALEFFKGALPGSRVRLHEFALYSPAEPRRMKERFTARGVRLGLGSFRPKE